MLRYSRYPWWVRIGSDAALVCWSRMSCTNSSHAYRMLGHHRLWHRGSLSYPRDLLLYQRWRWKGDQRLKVSVESQWGQPQICMGLTWDHWIGTNHVRSPLTLRLTRRLDPSNLGQTTHTVACRPRTGDAAAQHPQWCQQRETSKGWTRPARGRSLAVRRSSTSVLSRTFHRFSQTVFVPRDMSWPRLGQHRKSRRYVRVV